MEPLNVTDYDSYVVGDKYTPVWMVSTVCFWTYWTNTFMNHQMPSLKAYYVEQNMNSKHTLETYIRKTLNLDPASIWEQMEESIKTIYYMKEQQIMQVVGAYPQTWR